MSKCPRKVWDESIIFKDKEALKHEHDYATLCLLEEHLVGKNSIGVSTHIIYYEALLCKYCHSFKLVSKPGRFDGYITSLINGKYYSCVLTEEQKKLPRIIAMRSGNYSGLKHIDEFLFPDGKKYTKK